MKNNLKISAVVSTCGRYNEVKILLESLKIQDYKVSEVVVVDQNDNNKLENIISLFKKDFESIKHIKSPIKGVCRGRNVGWKSACGDLIFFPDDDSWYPSNFTYKAVKIFEKKDCDIVSGRPTDLKKRTINGRFLKNDSWINRKNVFFSLIEWVVIYKKEVLKKTNGYDELIGPGSGTKIGSGEAIDLSLRAFQFNFSHFFSYNLIAHHPEIVLANPNNELRKKIKFYAYGLGYVLKKNKYSIFYMIYWSIRPLGNIPYLFLKRDFKLLFLQIGIALNRLLGYISNHEVK